MYFHGVLLDAKLSAELAMQSFWVIAHHIQSAAFCGTFRAERANDDVAPGLHCVKNRFDIPPAQVRIDKKMKDGAVMPQIERPFGQRNLGNVTHDTLNKSRFIAQPSHRSVDSRA
jgi:hypothetical protein